MKVELGLQKKTVQEDLKREIDGAPQNPQLGQETLKKRKEAKDSLTKVYLEKFNHLRSPQQWTVLTAVTSVIQTFLKRIERYYAKHTAICRTRGGKTLYLCM